jgi:hypothetical protein
MLWLLLVFPCGAAFFQHYLGYYRYPEMRCIIPNVRPDCRPYERDFSCSRYDFRFVATLHRLVESIPAKPCLTFSWTYCD